jgi:hypothetical protein
MIILSPKVRPLRKKDLLRINLEQLQEANLHGVVIEDQAMHAVDPPDQRPNCLDACFLLSLPFLPRCLLTEC